MRQIALSFLVSLALAVMAVMAAPASAQFYPDPVDLGVNNEQQQIEEWFWPALIRQILVKRGPEAPSQCLIVSLANTRAGGNVESDCCQEPLPESCRRPLDPQEVVAVFGHFGILAEPVSKPRNADQVYAYLNSGRALLAGFFIAEDKKHAYLVRGISWEEDGRPMLLINDPHVTEPFRAPFGEEHIGWQTVIAIQ